MGERIDECECVGEAEEVTKRVDKFEGVED